MKLVRVNENRWIDIDDIYLVDMDENINELLVYIRMHPKIPVVIKYSSEIQRMHDLLEQHFGDKNEFKQAPNPKDVTEAGQTAVGFSVIGAESQF
jgi:hypothetical protein